MRFNKFLCTFIATCSVLVSNCSSQVIVNFQENDNYSVRLFEEPEIFNGIESFSQNLKNIASKYIDYTNINIENNNTIIFNNLIFNKHYFSVVNADKGIFGWFVLQNDCKSPRNIVLNYKYNE